jgi:hypothetical protein
LPAQRKVKSQLALNSNRTSIEQVTTEAAIGRLSWSALNQAKWLLPEGIFSVKMIAMCRTSPAPCSVCAVLICGLLFLQTTSTANGRGLQTQDKTTNAASSSTDVHPILVELFTSEGCSSCPPADAFLEKMDASQPVPGAQLIVLSEHVDYWDHDGWKDPNSSPALTERQIAYVRALQLKEPYTPQIIVDGTSELRANDQPQAGKVFQDAGAALKVPVRIGEVTVEAGSPSIVRAHIEADGTPDKRNAEVYVAVALNRVESQVSRGENSGRQLTHVAVVQQLTNIGKLQKGKSFDETVQLKLKPGTDPKNIRLVAFVQEPGPGKVLGAALRKPAS